MSTDRFRRVVRRRLFEAHIRLLTVICVATAFRRCDHDHGKEDHR